jgi:CheY-like chemotaxis protein
VLVVEDEVLIAMDLEMQLDDMGHESVGIAATEDTALSVARNETPDLALVDLRLANGGDGRAVAATLRRRFGIPCVLVSASLDCLSATDMALIGPVAMLSKPVTPAALGQTISSLAKTLKAA